jgi:hypothetical protein
VNDAGMPIRSALLAAAVACLAGLALPAFADAGQIGTATRLLKGKRFVTHAGATVANATIDRSADLCRNGRFTYRSTFLYPAADELQEQVVTGRWRVVSARIRGSRGTATVRYTADDGSTGLVRFQATGRGVYVDGQLAEVVAASC